MMEEGHRRPMCISHSINKTLASKRQLIKFSTLVGSFQGINSPKAKPKKGLPDAWISLG
jgi:hypothetical protein